MCIRDRCYQTNTLIANAWLRTRLEYLQLLFCRCQSSSMSVLHCYCIVFTAGVRYIKVGGAYTVKTKVGRAHQFVSANTLIALLVCCGRQNGGLYPPFVFTVQETGGESSCPAPPLCINISILCRKNGGKIYHVSCSRCLSFWTSHRITYLSLVSGILQ